MTSPWALEPSAQMVCMLVLSLRNFTEPSHIRMFAPPGWKLLRPYMPGFSSPLALSVLQLGYLGFGASSTLPSEKAFIPKAQASPRVGVCFGRFAVLAFAAAHEFSQAGKPATSVGLGMFSVPLFRAVPVGKLPTKMMS